MKYADSEWGESRYPHYAFSSVHSIYVTANLPVFEIAEPSAVLIAIAGGRGTLQTADDTLPLDEGSVVLLPADRRAVLASVREETLHAYMLKIGAYSYLLQGRANHAAGDVIQQSDITDGKEVRCLTRESSLAAKFEQLYIHRSPADEVRHVQNQLLLHEIILGLLERDYSGRREDELPSLERSMAYMENHYNRKISREQLANLAGMSPSHYSILFKQHTGLSPREYLTRLRVHRAMELLMTSSSTLREIALKTGFRDEFYLSRRFKQLTGASPSGFSPAVIKRIAVVQIPYASHLQLLGITPVVTVADERSYLHVDSAQPHPEGMNFVSIDWPPEQIKAALLSNGVEMILADKQLLQEKGIAAEQLRAISPVIEIPWMEMGWKDHLRQIARAVRRSELAERWLQHFEQEEQAARQAVKRSAAADECLSIIVIRPNKLLVYGARNVGYVMYQSLQLKPPALIQEQMDKHRDRFHSVIISRSQLADYAGDRLLVIPYPDDKGATAHAEALFQSAEWQQLPAVKHNRVHYMTVDDWIPYNPVSIRLQLHRAAAFFERLQENGSGFRQK